MNFDQFSVHHSHFSATFCKTTEYKWKRFSYLNRAGPLLKTSFPVRHVSRSESIRESFLRSYVESH